MIKWFLDLFGCGKIKSVESIMAPLVKTRDNLVKAEKQNNESIDSNLEAMKALEQANKAHAAEAHLANVMREGLDAQLKPLLDLKVGE
jgi:predicted negative regulator of RcsB-dependent stress response